MLSRRDKLLTQPWEERRFKDHRTKVKSALPVIDARAPAPRPHVTLKLKKCQREVDRMNKIRNDNFTLLQRLNNIMKVNRLDNRWLKPLPKMQKRNILRKRKAWEKFSHNHHKVGLFYDTKSLNDRISSLPALEATPGDATVNSKCYACHVNKKRFEFKRSPSPASSRESLPSINSDRTS